MLRYQISPCNRYRSKESKTNLPVIQAVRRSRRAILAGPGFKLPIFLTHLGFPTARRLSENDSICGFRGSLG